MAPPLVEIRKGVDGMKYTIEMSYSVGITVSDIVADSEEEAVKMAKRRVVNQVAVIGVDDVDCGPLKFKDMTFCEVENE